MLTAVTYDPAAPLPADSFRATHRAVRALAARLGDHPLSGQVQDALWAAASGVAVEGLRLRKDGVVDVVEVP
jgi:hypothetical protein